MNFGKNLTELRTKKGLTRKQLGNIIIVNEKTLSDEAIKKYETNEREPKFCIIEQLTIIFNCDYNTLFK